MEVLNILKQCRIEDKIVFLPDIQLDRKLYQEVAKKLELIGGKWNRKAKGFVFEQNPTELLSDIQNGEKRDLKKEFQFFETPSELAENLVSYISSDARTALEPSAGRGSIVRAMNRLRPDIKVSYCELMELNRKMFNGDAEFLQDDFLTLPENIKYDVVIANPPFSKNQDIEHFYKMCKVGKTVISIMRKHWQTAQNKKETAFRQFLSDNNTEIIDIETGAFKESGTMVGSCIVVLHG